MCEASRPKPESSSSSALMCESQKRKKKEGEETRRVARRLPGEEFVKGEKLEGGGSPREI